MFACVQEKLQYSYNKEKGKERWCDNVTVYSHQVFPKIRLWCFLETVWCSNDAPRPSKSPHDMLSPSRILFLQHRLGTHTPLALEGTACIQGRGEWQGNSVRSVALSRCPATATAGVCQALKPDRAESRISLLNTKKCHLTRRVDTELSGAAAPVNA